MAEYIERFGWKASDIGSKKIIKMVDYEAMRVAFDEKFKETMQLIESGETHLDNLAEGFHEADGVIFRLPAADVAPVVRCKDCKRCDGFPEPDDIQPNEIGLCKINMLAVKPDGFCSYGERRADNG